MSKILHPIGFSLMDGENKEDAFSVPWDQFMLFLQSNVSQRQATPVDPAE